MNYENLTGFVFGRFTVMTYSHKNSRNAAYWNCVCSCGVLKTVRAGSLKDGTIVSCGCYRKDRMSARRSKDGLSSARHKYTTYKGASLRRGFEFSLTFDQFYELSQQNCVYCNKKPAQVFKSAHCVDTLIYNGIDRRDNSLGYTVENCYPCCGNCNLAKRAMSHEEFISLCMLIADNWKNRI